MKYFDAIKKVEDSLSLLGIRDQWDQVVEPIILSGKLLNEFPELQELNDQLEVNEITPEQWAWKWCEYVEIYKRVIACKRLDKLASAV